MVGLLGGSGVQNAIEIQLRGDSSNLDRALRNAEVGLLSLKNVALGATAAVGAAATAGLGASVSAAADFDQAMQNSIAVMGDVDVAQREHLEQAARDVATSTTASHGEVAESYYFLASAGLDATESIEALPAVTEFAEAGLLDSATAADIATDTMTAYGLEAHELDRVMDTLTGTFTSHNQTARDMGAAMSYVAPIAAGLGMEIEETSAAIGLLGDAGIKGSRAGTTLRQALTRLQDPPAQVRERLEELGVQTHDSEGNFLGLTEVIDQFESAGLSAADMTEIFGQRAGPGMAVLLEEGSDAIDDSTRSLEEMDGITQDVADTQRDTFNAQMEIFKSNISDIGISIGEVLLPPLNDLLGHVADAAESFRDWVNSGNEVIAAAGMVGTAITGLGASVGLFLTKTATGASILKGLGAALTALTGPIGVVAAAVAGLAVAWQQNWFGIRDTTERVVGGISDYLGGALETIQNEIVGPVLDQLTEFWQAHGDQVTEILATFEEVVMTAFGMLESAIVPLVEGALGLIEAAWDRWGDNIMTIVEFTLDAVLNVVAAGLDAIQTALDVALAVLEGDWSAAWDSISSFVTDTLSGIIDFATNWGGRLISWAADVTGNILNTFEGWGSNIISTVQSAFDSVHSIISGVWGSITSTINSALNGIQSVFSSVWSSIQNTVSSAISGIQSVISSGMSAMQNTISGIWNSIQGVVSSAMSAIQSTVSSGWNAIQSAVSSAASGLQNTISNAWNSIQNTVSSVLNTIQSVVSSGFNAIQTTASNAINAVQSAFSTGFNAIQSTASSVMNSITGTISSAFSQIQSTASSAISAIQGAFTSGFNAIQSTATSVMGQIQNAVTSGFNAIQTTASNAINAIQNVFTSGFNAIQSTATSVMNSIQNAVTSGFNQIRTIAQSAINAVQSTVQSGFSQMVSAARSAISQMVSAISSGMARVRSAIQRGCLEHYPPFGEWLANSGELVRVW